MLSTLQSKMMCFLMEAAGRHCSREMDVMGRVKHVASAGDAAGKELCPPKTGLSAEHCPPREELRSCVGWPLAPSRQGSGGRQCFLFPWPSTSKGT